MRVLIVSNLFPPESVGGWELGCKQMAEELIRRKHDVLLLTGIRRTFETSGDLPWVRRSLHIEESWDPRLIGFDTPARLAPRFLVDTHNVEILRQAVESFAPDVVYLWNLVGIGGAALPIALDMRGIPWLVHLMDAMPKYIAEAAGSEQNRFGALLYRRLRGTWISCSQSLLDEISSVGTALQGDIHVISNWVTGPKPALREVWYQPGATLRCAYSGQIVAVKGISIIIDAVAALQAEGRAIDVDLFGDGLDRTAFEAQTIQLGVASAVHFRGHLEQSELMRRLQGYDIMLFPTAMREPFGFAPLEAAAAGCVPLVTEGAGISEWLMAGVHLITSLRNVGAVSDTLRAIQDGEIELAPIGRRGQRVVLRDFHIEVIADEVEAVLETVAAGASRNRAVASWEHIGRWARLGELLTERVLAHL